MCVHISSWKMGNRNLEQRSNIKALCEIVREGNWNVHCCPKHMTQKLWRKPVFLSGMNGSEWVKRNSHPSLLCRNIDKFTLTCVFKRSDLTLSTFFLHHDNNTVQWRYTGTQFVAKEIYCLTRTSTLFVRFCYFQK